MLQFLHDKGDASHVHETGVVEMRRSAKDSASPCAALRLLQGNSTSGPGHVPMTNHTARCGGKFATCRADPASYQLAATRCSHERGRAFVASVGTARSTSRPYISGRRSPTRLISYLPGILTR